MSWTTDDLRRYLRTLETGDPDRQLCNPEDDQKIVRWSIDEIERLQRQVETAVDDARILRAALERIVEATRDSGYGPAWVACKIAREVLNAGCDGCAGKSEEHDCGEALTRG